MALAGCGWWVTGGRWMIVATPSMGRAAPVGTLVFTRPVDITDITRGQVISFHPPLGSAEIYTHRVISIDADGAVHTRGDVNGGADPWALRQNNVVGVVVASWWGAGWLLRAVPLLAVSSVLLWALIRLCIITAWRAPLRTFGASLLVSVTSFVLKPFVRVQLISTTADPTGTHLTLVSTGLLPVRVTATGGSTADLVDGQVTALTGHPAHPADGVHLSTAVHLPPWGWLLMAALSFTPLLLALAIGSPQPPAQSSPAVGRSDKDHGEPPGDAVAAAPSAAPRRPTWHRKTGRKLRRINLSVLLTAAAALALAAPNTASAFTGQVNNTTNTAASASYFTCAASLPGIAAPALIWYLTETTTTSGAAAADVSGKARPGIYSAGITHSTTPACARDAAGSATFTGTTANVLWNTLITAPTTFSEIIWFKTTSTTGGRLLGFGSSNTQTGTSTNPDRHIYLSDTGKLVFGVLNGTTKIVATSPLSYNNGTWHQTAATLSPTNGMRLYVDGALVATNPNTVAGTANGYFRVGWDTLTGWTPTATNSYFTGNLGFFALYNTELTAATIQTQYTSGT